MKTKNRLLILFLIEIKNAELKNLSINTSNKEVSKEQQQKVKTDRIILLNKNLRASNALWMAGETPVAQMSYEEKKNLFGGKIPDLQGLEYYVGGIFELTDNEPDSLNRVNGLSAIGTLNDSIVPSFDWRNRHGRNWNTSVKNQNPCGGCWAFSAVAAVEGLTNLYYNQKIDLDLSEQQMISCTEGNCNGGFEYQALVYIIANGIVNESCFPYTATDDTCINICSNPVENIKIAGYQTYTHSGATLTVTATAFMQAHKVIIQDGGKIILSGGTIDDGNIIAQSGSELTITNNGKILLGSYNNLDIQLGAIFNDVYGEILLKQ